MFIEFKKTLKLLNWVLIEAAKIKAPIAKTKSEYYNALRINLVKN